jgi:predicted O-linked N-acetylglucosamine transferase (SPINDLY family)
MDYRITDGYADPPGTSEPYHSEELVRLPRCFLCYCPPADSSAVGPLPVLSSGRITFGSFNNVSKLSEPSVAMWSAILSAAANSRLVIKSQGLGDLPPRQHVLERFAAKGIGAERLELQGRVESLSKHLEMYHGIDVALDTYPYHGTATTCEAMWMGVPVVSLAGQTHASRVGVSLLSTVGLERLIARTPEQYVQIAVDLAKDVRALGHLRADLRQRMQASPLLDGRGFARQVESAYRDMWKRWCGKRRR